MKKLILISLALILVKEFSLAETSTTDYKYLNDMDYYNSGVDLYENGEFKKSFIVFLIFLKKVIRTQYSIYQICILRV